MVTSGDIQGFILEPILYAAYTNGIVECVKYGSPILHADDLKVVFLISKSGFPQLYDLIMHDFNNLSLWSETSDLNFNFSKCFVLHYSTNNPKLVYAVCGDILPAV